MGKGVQAAIKARQGERTGEVMQAAQHRQGALVMVLEVTGGNGGNGEHLTVTAMCKHMGAMTERCHHVVNHGKDRDNQRVVHRSLHASTRVQSTRIVRMCSVFGYPQSGSMLRQAKLFAVG